MESSQHKQYRQCRNHRDAWNDSVYRKGILKIKTSTECNACRSRFSNGNELWWHIREQRDFEVIITGFQFPCLHNEQP